MPVESNGSPQPPIPYHQNGHSSQNRYSSSPLIVSTPINAIYQRDELDLNQILRIVQRRVWLIAGVAIATTSVIWGWTLTRTPIYKGEFRVLVESVSEADRSQQLLQDSQIQLGPAFDYDTQIEVLRSPALLKPIADSLRQTYPDINVDSLAANLVISRLRDTKVLSVSYLATDPEKIQAVLSEVSQHYLRYSFQQRQSSLQQGVQFVEDQLPELRERVNTLQVRLERFRQEYSLIDPESRGNDLSGLISGVEKQRQETQTQLIEAQSLYRALQQQLGLTPEQALAASALSESPRYQNLLNQIREVESEIAVESARFLPDSPFAYTIQALKDKRAELLPLLDQEAERILGEQAAAGINGELTATSLELSQQLVSTANEVQVLQTRSEALAAVEQRLKREFDLVPALAREYTDLQRELAIATESLNRFLETRETLQIDAAQKSIPWELISGPATLQRPISPKVPRNLALGAIAGLVLGSAAAFIAEKLNSVFHSPEELKAVTKLPLLGVIPFVKELHTASSSSRELSDTATGHINGDRLQLTSVHESSSYQASPFFEAFRSLYANIRFLSSDTSIRSLVISSAAPAEGKSTTALNLARAAAAMGQRVALVDADLRCPQVHKRLGLPNLRGLSNAIVNEMRLQQVVQRSPLDDNVYVITAGPTPPDPTKLLSSQRMQTLMERLREQFDLVIYDMPPLLGFADSSLLTPHTDGLVLVVGLGKTGRTDLTQALEGLKISPISVLGIVTNGIKAHTAQTYGYYRYQNYYRQNSSDVFQNGSSSGLSPSASLAVGQVGVFRSLMNQVTLLSPRTTLLIASGVGTTAFLIVVSWILYNRLVTLPSEPPSTSRLDNLSALQPVSPAASPLSDDPFADAVRIAEKAITATASARTQADWFAIENHWQRAADLMLVVPLDDNRYAIAQDRVSLYRSNGQYARQKAEEAIVR